MAKKAYVYDGSAWQDLSSSIADLSTYQKIARDGLISVVPTSVSVGSGSASVATNGAVTFSGASSVSLNGCFTSTYDNYRVIISGFTASSAGNVDIGFQMRSNGTPAAGSTDYSVHYARIYYSGSSSNLGNTGQVSGSFSYQSAGGYGNIVTDFIDPAQARHTFVNFKAYHYQSDIASYIMATGSNAHKVATAYDGWTIFPGSGTITGTIRIYGYNNNS